MCQRYRHHAVEPNEAELQACEKDQMMSVGGENGSKSLSPKA